MRKQKERTQSIKQFFDRVRIFRPRSLLCALEEVQNRVEHVLETFRWMSGEHKKQLL